MSAPLPIFLNGGNDQPTTCPECGARTEWTDAPTPSEDGWPSQTHTCLACGYRFELLLDAERPAAAAPEDVTGWPTETRTGYLVRTASGDRWFYDGDDGDAFEASEAYLLDQGGRLYEVTVESRVTRAQLVDTDEGGQ